jgi:YD repeat-containing protein
MTEVAPEQADVSEDVAKDVQSGNFEEVYNELNTLNDDPAAFQENLDVINQKLENEGVLPGLDIVGVDEASKGIILKNESDGSTRTVDQQGRTIASTDANGNSVAVKYKDEHSTDIVEIKETRNGQTHTYTKQGNDWVDEKGNKTGARDPVLDKDGNYSFKNADGSKTTRKSDGTEVVSSLDDQDKPETITYPDGSKHTIKYNGQDVAAVLGADGKPVYAFDGKQWVNGKGEPQDFANIRYDSKGNQIITTKDDADVTTNTNGKVTDIAYADGSKRSFTYNDKGIETITETARDGQTVKTYHQNDKGQWVDEKGVATGNSNPQVDAEGNYSFTNKDGKTVTTTTDGKQTVSEHGFKKDEQGRVVEVDYPNGKKQTFSYDKTTGELNQITDADGNKWTLGADKQWHATKANGDVLKDSKGNPVVSDAKVFVDDHGNYNIWNSDGSKEKYNPDGSSTRTNADGSAISRDTQGRIDEIKTANGDTTKISYGTDGKINGYDHPAVSYQQGADGKWTMTDKKTGQTTPADVAIAVDDFGTVKVVDKQTGMTKVAKADGSYMLSFKDQPLGIFYADGTTQRAFKYDDRGQLIGVQDQNNQWAKGADGLWRDSKGQVARDVQVDKQGNYIIKEANGTTTYRYTDNTSTAVTAGGTKVHRDDAGVITGVDLANGNSWQFDQQNERWVEYNSDGKQTGKISNGTPNLDAQGDVTFKSNEGSTTYKKDGSTVQANARGQVTEVAYQDGTTRKYTYDANGNVASVTERDGKVHNLQNGQSADGGKVSVLPDGTMQVTYPDGHVEIRSTYDPNRTRTVSAPQPVAGPR